MGNPAIYFYPDPEGSLEVLDFGEPLSDLQITQLRDVIDGYSRGGSFHRVTGASRLEIRIILENFTSASLVRKFETLSAHLERGGAIGFSLDHDKTWAGFVQTSATSPVRGRAALTTSGNAFNPWSTSAALDLGDEVVISSAPVEGLRETNATAGTTPSSAVAVNLGISSPLVYTYKAEPVLVRWRDFYPCLIMPEGSVGSPILETNHRISYTLDLTVVEDWGTIAALADGLKLRDTNGSPSTGVSLQEATGAQGTLSASRG
tara:strand:- start:1240 stop:2025 length:786 start_codon:yes stop_codon:yes gene_type:complete